MAAIGMRVAERAHPFARGTACRLFLDRNNTMLACEVADSTGDLTALFYGRTHITGLEPGRRIRLHGVVGIGGDGRPTMVNPRYELLG